jgi:hypothetical protein
MTATAHHVALTMAPYAHADGNGIEVGVATIARDAKLRVRAVQYALRELERLGVVLVVRPGGGAYRPTAYRLNPALDAPFDTQNGAPGAPFRAGTVHETVHETKRNGASNGALDAPEEVVRGLEEGEDARAIAPEASRASADVDAMAIAEAWHLWRDPTSPPYVRKAARRTIFHAGDGALLEREEAVR